MSLNIYSYHMLQVLYWVCKSEGATAHRLQVSSLYFPPPASSRRYLLIIISITIVIRRIVSLGGPNGSQPVYKVNNKHFQSSQNTQKAILKLNFLWTKYIQSFPTSIHGLCINYWLSELKVSRRCTIGQSIAQWRDARKTWPSPHRTTPQYNHFQSCPVKVSGIEV